MVSEAFLNPKSIAVYGASERPNSPAAHILRNLTGQGFSGDVSAINPKYEIVASRPCFPSQVVAGLAADLAIIAIPPAAVPVALQDCAAVGTKAAVIITAGFDNGSGPASKARLVKAAREAAVTFVGPNCLGIIRPIHQLNATFQPTLPPSGGLALISQSGAICSAMADMADAQGMGFSLMLSLGNSFNWGLPEAIDAAAGDPRTKVILLYIEGVRRGEAFRAALARACREKPVIVLKAGRHAAGSEAAATHTGALIGSDKVFGAVLEEAGAVQVQTLGGLIQTARLLEHSQIRGPRLAIVTNGGGAGVLAADRLSDRQLPCAPLPEAMATKLDETLSPNWSRRNPLDIVGDAAPNHYEAAINACLASDSFDAVLALLSPQSMTTPAAVADVLVRAKQKSRKPVLSCFLGGSNVASARTDLKSHGVADFDLPEDAIVAFHSAVRVADARTAGLDVKRLTSTRDTAAGRESLDVGPFPPGMLSDINSRQILANAGVPCPIPMLARSEEAAVALAADLPGAAVLKVVSPDISHKSEVDGVYLNVKGAAEICSAYREIKSNVETLRPDAQFTGVTVEPFVDSADSRELLVGVTQDPVFGPVITFGAGGTLVELLDDVSTALLPLTHDRAMSMIEKTKVSTLLGPYRNMRPVSVDAVVELLLAVSELCLAHPEIEEMDINPLLASPAGLCAVDARIRIRELNTPMIESGQSEL